MKIDGVGATDIGQLRARNEDAYLLRVDLGVFAVADGMGGHAAGDVASRTAISTFENIIAANSDTSDTSWEQRLAHAMQAANVAVWQRSNEEPDKAGMGTTMTALAFPPGNSVAIAHVGDSRLYRVRMGELHQLTTDHTVAQELISQGQLTRQAARRHPLSSTLLRALGTSARVAVDLFSSDVAPDDLFILCSDGLTTMLDDEDLLALAAQPKPLDTLAAELIAAANLRGGVDNITVILMRATVVSPS